MEKIELKECESGLWCYDRYEVGEKLNELIEGYNKIVRRLGDAMNIKDYYEDDKYNFK